METTKKHKVENHEMDPPKRRVIISGGGTGGHVFPAIAIAQALQRLSPGIEIRFVGAQGKIEMEKVPQAGFPIDGLWISGFQRRLTWRNLLFPLKLIYSLLQALRIVGRFRPQAAVGVGGYASYPTLATAAWRGVPTLIQEQNSHAGVANKMLRDRVRKVCVAYEGMERYFPADKLVFTGNPVRADLREVAALRSEAFRYFGFDPERPTIVLIGGSLGARSLNEAMAANTEVIREAGIQVLWQVGKLYVEEFADGATVTLPQVKAQAFIDRMDLAYAMADVVICRAGALTISELCVLGKAAILVPSPNVAEDHQTKNALALVEREAAVLVEDGQASQEMIQRATDLLAAPERKRTLEQNIRQLARPNAAERIAREVLALIGGAEAEER